MVETQNIDQSLGSGMDTNSDKQVQQDLGPMEVDRDRTESDSEPKQKRSYLQSLQGTTNCNRPTTQLSVLEGDFEKIIDELGPKLKVSDHIECQIDKALEFAVVTKLLGRPLGYNILCQRIKNLWNLADGYQVLDMQEGYFLIKLSSAEEMNQALLDGPWTIMGHCLLVQKWVREFRASSSTIGKTAMWIRLLDLPVQYYHERVLWEVGNLLGRTLKLDQHTRDLQRAKFARIAIEFDLANPLIPKFRINDHWIRVEYEGLPLVCFGCGRIGHNQQCCPFRAGTDLRKGSTVSEAVAPQQGPVANAIGHGISPTTNTDSAKDESEFGPWIHAQRRGRRNPANGISRQDQLAGTNSGILGTRFDMLRVASEEPNQNVTAQIGTSESFKESNHRDDGRNTVMSGKFSKGSKAKEQVGNVFSSGSDRGKFSKGSKAKEQVSSGLDKDGPSITGLFNFRSPVEHGREFKPVPGSRNTGVYKPKSRNQITKLTGGKPMSDVDPGKKRGRDNSPQKRVRVNSNHEPHESWKKNQDMELGDSSSTLAQNSDPMEKEKHSSIPPDLNEVQVGESEGSPSD